MELDKRYAGIGIAIIVLLLIGGSGILNFPLGEDVRDINDYGTIEMTSNSEVVESLDNIQASGGLEVIWTATVSTSDINAWMYTTSGTSLEKGIHTQNGNIHTFSFTLDGAPQGITEMYVAFGGMYSETESWVGSTPYFFVEQDATPSYPAPQVTHFPDDQDAETGEQIHLSWWFIYSGPATARITKDGVTISSRATTQTAGEQPISCDVYFSDVGVHKVKLIIEPDYDIPYANEVTITVTAAAPPTTTTTTAPTTTPPTGTTSTTATSPPDDPMITVMSGIALVGIVAVIIVIQLRGRKD
jgi:hypothetical protein